MRRILFAILLILSFGVEARAQSTTVSGTITDANGQAFASGTYKIEFNANGKNPPFQWNGAVFNPATFSGALDGSGNIPSTSVPSSSAIGPAGTQWRFTVCPASTSPCYSANVFVTGTTMNVSGFITPPAITIPANAYNQPTAYTDAEIAGPIVGFSYFNLTSQANRTCTVSVPCTWVNGGGGSGIVNPGTQYFIPLYPNGGSASVIGPSNIFTDSTKNNLTVPGNALFTSGQPWYDVMATDPGVYTGAKCDGTTDDTTAITNLYNLIVSNGNSNLHSSGIMYFPRSVAGLCRFNGSAFSAAHGSAWLYVIMDNSFLLTGPVTPSKYTSFIGRSGTFQGAPSSFGLHPSVTWATASASTELLNLTGNIQSVYIEGVNFENPIATVPLIDMECDGSGNAPSYITLHGIVADNQTTGTNALKFACVGPLSNGGYNLFVDMFSMGTAGSTVAQFTNTGQIYFSNGTFIDGGVAFTNNDGSTAGGGNFQNIEVEGLSNQDFLTLDSSAGGGDVEQNFKLIQVQLADTGSNVYMVKGVGQDNNGLYIQGTDTGNFGAGMIDPATTNPGGLIDVQCLGYGCNEIYSESGLNILSVGALTTFPFSSGKAATQFNGADSSVTTGNDPSGLGVEGSMDFLGISNSFVTAGSNPPSGTCRVYTDSSNTGWLGLNHSNSGCNFGTSAHPWGTLFATVVTAQGASCTNGELALSAGWGNTAAVSAVAGLGQTCQWTITSNGTGTAANPTITDTLTNPLPTAATVCEMRMVGGTGTSTLINETTLSATAPIFTFGGTPGGSGATYFVVRRCGP